MAVDIVMPRLSDTMESGKVLHWLKKEGEEVKKGEPLVEIETDKANMELEAYENGKLEKIVVGEGQSAPVGQLIAVLQTEIGEKAPSPPPAEATKQAEPTRPTIEVGPVEKPAAEKVERPERMKVSPLARRIAEEHDIDLGQVQGTGPGGRITREDVEKAIAKPGKAAPAPTPTAPTVAAAPPPPAPEKAPTPAGVRIVELDKMQTTIADRMVKSKTTVPHFYVTNEVDMQSAMALRKQLNSSIEPSPHIGINDMVIKAVALALTKFPKCNAFFRDGKLEEHPYVNIGIAVSLQDGLVVPVLHDCDKKSLKEIAQESDQLLERIRAGKFLPGDLDGGTFSITNLGMYDVDEFSAIINPPESGILAVGSIKRKPVVVNDQITIGDRMHLTLSVDHRVYYGFEAAQFLQEIKRLLENPVNLLI